MNFSLVGQEVIHAQGDENERNEYFGIEEHMIAKPVADILFVRSSLGSRVAVFSHRPSVVKKSLDIDYKRPRVAEDENLGKFEKEILAALRHQGPK